MKSAIRDEILVGAKVAGYREASRRPSSQFYLAVSFPPPTFLPPSPSFYQSMLAGLEGAKKELGGG